MPTKPDTKTTAIEKAKTKEIVIPEQFTITPEDVKRYINEFATVKEVGIFIKQCEMFNLNPFKREIYLIKYNFNTPAAYVIGFEVFLKRAERTDRLDGWEWGTEGSPEKPEEFKAWIKIYRKDWKYPFCHEVFYNEYVGKKKDGTITKFWAGKPRTMLKKVVAGQGFRLCFPDELGGLPYTTEEIDSIDHQKLPKGEVKKEKPSPKVEPKKEAKKEPEAPTEAPEQEKGIDTEVAEEDKAPPGVLEKDQVERWEEDRKNPKDAPEKSPEKEQPTLPETTTVAPIKTSSPANMTDPDEKVIEAEVVDEKEENTGDPIHTDQKAGIKNMVSVLVDMYDRDEKALVEKILERVKKKYGVMPDTFPDGLHYEEADFVIRVLNKTMDKAKATQDDGAV